MERERSASRNDLVHATCTSEDKLCDKVVRSYNWPKAAREVELCEMCKEVLKLEYERARVKVTVADMV